MGDFLSNLISMFIIFMIFRGILRSIFGSKRRRYPKKDYPEGDSEQNEENYPADKTEPEYPEEYRSQEELAGEHQDDSDLAADFERRLRKTTEAAETEQKSQTVNDEEQVIYRDSKVYHDNPGRIHRDDENLTHDKSHVYKEKTEESTSAVKNVNYEPKGLYSTAGKTGKVDVAAIQTSYAWQANQPRESKIKFKHAALVKGFIISQILAKPRALKPYGEDELI